MLKIIKGDEVNYNLIEMEKVWSLRHEIFVEEMQWSALSRPDKREFDQFDDEHAIHMLAFENDELVGYQRLLPTTRPNLLSNVYPQLCETKIPNAPHVWEWTRYAVKKPHRVRGRKLSPIANKLLSGIVEWGLENGVSTIVIEMNPLWLLRLAQFHFIIVQLGITHVLDGEEVLAVEASFDERTLARLQELRGNSEQVLSSKTGNEH